MSAVPASWDAVWMMVADSIAQRSRCVRRQIGAVIVTRTNRPIAMGYNGAPAKMPAAQRYSCDMWCIRGRDNAAGSTYSNCVSIHAEANAFLFADRRDYEGGTLYVTSVPCWECAKLIANSGILRLVTRHDVVADAHRKPQNSIGLLAACGVEVVTV